MKDGLKCQKIVLLSALIKTVKDIGDSQNASINAA